MYRVLSQARLMDLLANLEPVRIATDEELLHVSLAISPVASSAPWTEHLSLAFTPAGGEVRVDLREILRPYFRFRLPSGAATAQPDMLLHVKFFFMREERAAYELTVLRSGVDMLEDNTLSWVKTNALTAQPRTKRVAWQQPEWLTLYLEKDKGLMATPRVRPSIGSEEIETRDSVLFFMPEQTGVYTLDVSLVYLAGTMSIPEGELLVNLDIVSPTGKVLMRYVPDGIRSEDERWFFWENSLGGLDTMRATGTEVLMAKPEAKAVDYQDEKRTYEVESPRTWQQNTGSITSRERLWLLDFLQSPYRYIYRLGKLIPIAIEEATLESPTADEAYDFSFQYRLAAMPKGMDAELMSEEPTAVAPPWLTPVDFPGAPLPAEWELLTPVEGLLLPALIAGTNTWGALSYGAIVEDVAKRLRRWIEDYIRQQIQYHMGTGPLAYTFDCLSSNGTTFYSGQGTTELRAVVRRGYQDITDLIPPRLFSWTRKTRYPENDEIWNQAHVGYGPKLTITAADIYRHAYYEYSIEIADIEDALRGVVIAENE